MILSQLATHMHGLPILSFLCRSSLPKRVSNILGVEIPTAAILLLVAHDIVTDSLFDLPLTSVSYDRHQDISAATIVNYAVISARRSSSTIDYMCSYLMKAHLCPQYKPSMVQDDGTKPVRTITRLLGGVAHEVTISSGSGW